jgi:hypothetical protein
MDKTEQLKPGLLYIINQALVSHGFRRSHQSFFRRIPIGSQILHLAFVQHGNTVEIKANAEVRHDELEELYSDLLGEPHSFQTATVGAEFGKLAGTNSIIWTVNNLSDIPVISNKILASFWDIGWPFLETYSSLEKIFVILMADETPARDYCSIHHVRAEKALVAAFLLGRKDIYHELIDAKIAYLTKIENPYLKDFLEFVIRFKSKVEAS